MAVRVIPKWNIEYRHTVKAGRGNVRPAQAERQSENAETARDPYMNFVNDFCAEMRKLRATRTA